jgi:DNA-binding NarL/FixJ family response regulator
MVAKKKKNGKNPQKPVKTNQKTEEKPKERKYPYLSEHQERAVIMKAMGQKTKYIATSLNKSEYTVNEWFRLPEIKQALEQENLDIIANQRDSYGQITEMAYMAIRENIQADPSLAFAWLKETGHLPKSVDKAEKEKVVEEILKRMQSAIMEG